MNISDLKKYCEDASYGRVELSAPWSDDKYTYASNGHIIVRVPKIEDASIKSNSRLPGSTICKYFDKVPAEWFVIPEVHPKIQDCGDCNGKGKFKYRGETVSCEECDGKGTFERHISVEVGGALFSDVYLSWIAELPNPKIGPFQKLEPARFTFDGGDGLLMPRRS